MGYELVLVDKESGDDIGEIDLDKYPTDNHLALAQKIDELISEFEEENEEDDDKVED